MNYNFYLPIDLYLLKLKDLQLNARLHSFEQDSTSRELKMSRTRNEKNLYPLLSRVKQSRNKHGNYAKSISIDMCLLLPRVYQLKLSLMIIFFLKATSTVNPHLEVDLVSFQIQISLDLHWRHFKNFALYIKKFFRSDKGFPKNNQNTKKVKI